MRSAELDLSRFTRGIKAGIVAGLVYGILYAFIVPICFALFSGALGVPTAPSFGDLYAGLQVNPLMGIIYGLFWGTVLGLIYALVYDRLPGRRIWKLSISETKGTLLSMSVWFIVTSLGISNRLRQGVDVGWATWPALQIVLSATGLGLYILLGLQLGYFWDKFKPKESEEPTLTPVPAQRVPEALAPTVSIRRGARPAGTKYCIECGEQIPEVSMYCQRCGKRQE